MKLSLLDNILWAAGFIGHVVLLLILLFRKRFKTFPGLTFYIGFEALTTVALFLISRCGTKHAYFLVYWSTGFGEFPLELWIILGLARNVFRPIRLLIRETQKTFWAFAALGLLTAATLSFGVGNSSGSKGFDLWENRTSIFTSLVVCGLIIVISVVANSFGVLQGRHSVAVEQGIFLWSYGILLSDLAHAIFGWHWGIVPLSYGRSFLYLAVLLYWVVVFLKNEEEQPPLPPEMIAYMSALHDQIKYDIHKLDGLPK